LFPYFKERLACFDRKQARGSQSSPHVIPSRADDEGSHNRGSDEHTVYVSNERW
jgi:hypothetical protein